MVKRILILSILLFSISLNITWVWGSYHTSITNWLEYHVLNKPYSPIITTQIGLFPRLLFNDGYHYIYLVEADEFNASEFPVYFTSDGREYLDLGRVDKIIDARKTN